MKTKNIEICGIEPFIAYCEAEGLAKCFSSYAHNCAGEEICQIGFNPHSGYVYIYLENGVSICSMLGADVEYLITNGNDGTEYFFDSYTEAENFDPYEEETESDDYEHPEHDEAQAEKDNDLEIHF